MVSMIKKVLLISVMCLLSTSAFARSGCCSHHGGVAACGSDGYEQCNDGSESPSCTCADYDKSSDNPVQKKRGNGLFTQNRQVNPYLEPVTVSYLKTQVIN